MENKKQKSGESPKIQFDIIGFVRCPELTNAEVKDLNLISRIEFIENFVEGLKGIEEFSHIYIIFWLDGVEKTSLQFTLSNNHEDSPIGIYATRAPIRPNHIGLSLVEIVKHEGKDLWVRGLDAYNGTPVLDVKPYPNWGGEQVQVVTDFKIPKWLSKILNNDKKRET